MALWDFFAPQQSGNLGAGQLTGRQTAGMLLGGLGQGLSQMSHGQPVNIMSPMLRQRAYMEQQDKQRRLQESYQKYIEEQKKRQEEADRAAQKRQLSGAPVVPASAQLAVQSGDPRQMLQGIWGQSPAQPTPTTPAAATGAVTGTPQSVLAGPYGQSPAQPAPAGMPSSLSGMPARPMPIVPPSLGQQISEGVMPDLYRGGEKHGGNKFGGNTFGGNKFGGYKTNPAPAQPTVQVGPDGTPLAPATTPYGQSKPSPLMQTPIPDPAQPYGQTKIPGGLAGDPLTGDRQNNEAVIANAANKLGVPLKEAQRLMSVENASYDPSAVNQTAVGLTQLTPITAKEMGISNEDRLDPVKNAEAGLGYYAKLKDEFGSDEAAYTAYHMGPTAYRNGKKPGPETTKAVNRFMGRPEDTPLQPYAGKRDAKKEAKKIENTYKAANKDAAKVASKMPVTDQMRAVAANSNGMFTTGQLRLAEALGYEKGGAMLAKIASSAPQSRWEIVNAGNGVSFAVDRQNPRIRIPLSGGTGAAGVGKKQYNFGKFAADMGLDVADPKQRAVALEEWKKFNDDVPEGMMATLDKHGNRVLVQDPTSQARELNASMYSLIKTEEIGRAKDLLQNQKGLPATGISAWVQKKLGDPAATNVHKLNSYLDTIRSTVGFKALQDMRAASSTGGAIGQVSNFEQRLLQSVFGSMDAANTKEDLYYNLERLRIIEENMWNLKGVGNDGIIKSGDNKGVAIESLFPPAPGEVEDGMRFKGMDPADPNNWEEVN